jgi:hypothetical protein
MDRPNAPTVLHVIAAWASDTAHDDAVYRVDPAPGAWYVAEMAVSPTGPRLLPRMVTSTPPAVGMLPRLLPTATDSESMEGTTYDDVTLASDSALTSDATVTVHRYPDPTPTTLTHLIVTWATVTSHDVAVRLRPVLPPLYTATSGATKSPALGFGPKFVPTSTTNVLPDVDITPAADVTVGGPYDIVAVDHDPF